MSLNSTPSADRVHIGIFGKRNAGKSSIINALTNQNLAIVADVAGTTTDPVYKAMELLPLGPVMIIDTPGIDDVGELGALRVKKSYQVLNKTDIALLIVDGPVKSEEDEKLVKRIKEKEIPCIIAYNKCDDESQVGSLYPETGENEISVSAVTKFHIHELKEMIAASYKEEEGKIRIVGDLLKPSDLALLVIPIDKAAPKGRLILPQQQTIRDILDANAGAIMVKETELADLIAKLGVKPALVITDSQVFAKASADTPKDIPLTSFSILMARHKGILDQAVEAIAALENLKDGDKVLISEGCTHHRQCDDIGTYKIPKWVRAYTGKELEFVFTSGTEFPEDLSAYAMIIHCGGCMLNEREMKYRMRVAKEQNIPMTNYGILIAEVQGTLRRSVKIFPHLTKVLEEAGVRGMKEEA